MKRPLAPRFRPAWPVVALLPLVAAACSGGRAAPPGDGPPPPSGGIAAIREALDGPLALPVTRVTVTYLKPAVGLEPAGFFVQEDPPGPGVFVAVDPSTLSPAPAVGDTVSFTATARQRSGALVQVTGVSAFAVVATGRDVEPLRVDVSGVADLPAVVGVYESELVSISGTLTAGAPGVGIGFLGATLATAGTPASSQLVLRVPAPVRDASDVALGCVATVRAPLWRYASQVLVTAWTVSDLELHACPAPRVLSAVATTPTSVLITFDRHLDAASVAADGSQFALTDGLAATAAAASGKAVLVSTSPQLKAHPYAVAVADGVRDTVGTPVDRAASTATFVGHRNPALLRITEAAPAIGNDRDLVELLVVQDGTTVGMTLRQDDVVVATFPDASVLAGDLVVVHLNPAIGSPYEAPASETVAKDEHATASYRWNYDQAWDFHGGTSGIDFSSRVLRIADPSGTTQDGAAFTQPWSSQPASFPTALQRLQADGGWQPSDCGGAPCTYASSPSATDPSISASWDGVSWDPSITVRRADPLKDADRASDWAVGPSSFGAL